MEYPGRRLLVDGGSKMLVGNTVTNERDLHAMGRRRDGGEEPNCFFFFLFFNPIG